VNARTCYPLSKKYTLHLVPKLSGKTNGYKQTLVQAGVAAANKATVSYRKGLRGLKKPHVLLAWFKKPVEFAEIQRD
jgi:hypothetical protein